MSPLFVFVNMNKNTKQQDNSPAAFIYSVLGTLLLCMLCVFVLFTFVFRLARVSGQSMEPGLKDGNVLLVSDLFYKPDYSDIIVIQRTLPEQSDLIKRIIALPGDTVDIDFDAHIILVNGSVLNEPYGISSAIAHTGDVSFPLTVPDNCYFVLGDNRNASLDSRFSSVGFIHADEIGGRAICRLIPFSAIN